MSGAFGESEIHKIMIGRTIDGHELGPVIGQVMDELALAAILDH